MSRTTIAHAATELLADHRALTADALGSLVRERGLTRAAKPGQAVTRALGDNPSFRRLTDGRWVVPAQLLRGAVLTHRLTQPELERNVLALEPDLAPLVGLASLGVMTGDGRPLLLVWDGAACDVTASDTDAALEGPEGWPASWPAGAAGELIHVRLAGQLLDVASGPDPAPASRLAVRRLSEAARRRLQGLPEDIPFLPAIVSIEQLVLDLLADDATLLAEPLPPLGETLRAGGLEVHRGNVGLPGTDWGRVDEFLDADWDDDAREADSDWGEIEDGWDEPDPDLDGDEEEGHALLERFADTVGLEPREAEAVEIVFGAYELSNRLGTLADPNITGALASMLSYPGVARVVGRLAWTDPGLEPFVRSIDVGASPRAAGPAFVLAACAETRDDVVTAEAMFRTAVEADPTFGPALIELARYETDRGDYGSALRRLRAAGVPAEDPERAWLETRVAPAYRNVGRNERCPCGSGRKFKACHLGQPAEAVALPPAEALLFKIGGWLTQPDVARLVTSLLREVTAGQDHAPSGQGDHHSVAADVLLFDRGQLSRFLDVRGPLLPEAERVLGRAWLATRRSLYEVRAVRPGDGVTLRDLRGPGTLVDVPDRSLSRQAGELDLLCMRLLPDGAGGVVASDALLVPRLRRRQVLDLIEREDDAGLLRWILVPEPPPTLQNMEGEPLQFLTSAYRVADPAATAAALADRLRPEGRGRFSQFVTRRGEEWIRGSITLAGDRATIQANSERRFTRLERLFRKVAPGAELVSRESRSLQDALQQDTESPPPAPLDRHGNPDLARVLDEFMQRSEANWVDEHTPALGGLTPRQALHDRRMRPELEALLDDIAWEHRRAGGEGMNPGRLRERLGLPPPGH